MDIDNVPVGGGNEESKNTNRKRRRLVPRRHPHEAPEYTTALIELTNEGVVDV